MTKIRIREPGRGWAYTGMIAGGLVSVAANVAHSFIPPTGAPTDWSPKPGAIFTACVWPIFLLMIVEVHARVQWPSGKGWWLLRWIGFPPVAGVAAFVSYRHLSGLLAYYGEEQVVSWFGPLAVDGLMITCTAALLAINHRVRVAAMLASAAPVSTPPVVVAAPIAAPLAPITVPSVTAPLVSVVDASPTPAVVLPAPVVPPPTRPAPESVPAPVMSPAPAIGREPAPAPTVRPAPSTTNISVTASDAAPPPLSVPLDKLNDARRVARDYLTENGAPISVGGLAVRLHVPSALASRLLAALDAQPDSPTKPARALNGSQMKVSQ